MHRHARSRSQRPDRSRRKHIKAAYLPAHLLSSNKPSKQFTATRRSTQPPHRLSQDVLPRRRLLLLRPLPRYPCGRHARWQRRGAHQDRHGHRARGELDQRELLLHWRHPVLQLRAERTRETRMRRVLVLTSIGITGGRPRCVAPPRPTRHRRPRRGRPRRLDLLPNHRHRSQRHKLVCIFLFPLLLTLKCIFSFYSNSQTVCCDNDSFSE